MHALLDAALDSIVIIDHRGLVVEFNQAAQETFGYSRDQVLGQELAELIVPPELRPAHRRALARWTEKGPKPGAGKLLGHRIEVEAMRADGSVFPAELAIGRIDVPGPPLFTACVRDISRRRDAETLLRSAEFRYRMLVEELPLITYVHVPEGATSKLVYLSPQVETLLGYSPEEWLRTPGYFESLIHEDDRDAVLAERRQAYEGGEELSQEFRMVAADGRIVWVEDRSVLVESPEGGQPLRQGFAVDVTERKLTQDAVLRTELRYRSLVEQLPLSVYIDRLDEVSSNVYTSPQIESMLGYSVSEWVENPDLFVELLHPEDRERVLAAHQRTHATGEPLQVEYRLHTRDGRAVWVQDEARVVSDAGEPVLQGYLLDVTARREAEEQLRHQAFHDALTGLANRALFTNRVEHALVLRSQQARREVAVLFLDLDDFKAVNDTLGHAAGDTLLRGVGVRLRDALSERYTVARLGGDEFAILIEDLAGPSTAVDTAERVVTALQAPFEVEEREVFVTASVGIAVGSSADELLRSADVAMYRAKASGKAQYVMYAPRMAEDLVGRLELVAELRRARVDQEFVVYYQPVVDLESGAVVGVEALVRWAHPTRGLLPPSDFIPLAEETGKIVELGAWVLRESCADVARWRAETPGAATLTLNVNVSTRQVRPGVLVEDVRAALAESGLPSEALTLELTESVLARRHEELRAVLADVAALGVRLALDDFGTGYSSLSLLQDLPVHTLKVDRSFVTALDADATQQGFVQAIVDLAHTLDVSLVAEGMETASQTSELRRLGCRVGQGFHFAPPLEPGELGDLLAAGACASLESALAKRSRPEAA